MSEEVVFAEEQQVGLIYLNRPKVLNALNLAMIKAIQQKLTLWQENPAIHAVIIQAEGDQAFCAGGDVRWLYQAGLQHDPMQLQFFWHEYRLNHFIHQFRKPYVALLHGLTMGGGVGISLHGSYPLASEQFIFAMPETAIGFFPDIGASYLLSHCPGYFGEYLALTGTRINVADAIVLGLVNSFLPRECFADLTAYLLAVDLSQDAHQVVRQALQNFAKPAGASQLESIKAGVDIYFSKDSVEAIFQALAASKDAWSKQTLAELKQKSPLSLKVTLAQLKKAKNLSMAQCIEMDYCLVKKFMQGHDFYEGVRALLINKDNHPQWQPKTLAEVSEQMVVDYFVEMNKPIS